MRIHKLFLSVVSKQCTQTGVFSIFTQKHWCLRIPFVLITNFLITFAVFAITPARCTAVPEAYELLIIGPEPYRPTLQRFIDFKLGQGIVAHYFSVESINESLQGSDLAWKLHEFVSEEFKRSGIKYLLLVGTYERVPTKYVYSPSYEVELADFNYKPTDWYYAVPDWEDSKIGLLGGNIPKIAVGRLPVRDEEELERTLSKMIKAEAHPEAGSFLLFGDLSDEAEPVPNVPYICYVANGNLTSKLLSKTLFDGVAYAMSYSHGTASALWTKTNDGEWKTLLTCRDVEDIEATYSIQFLIACFTGALDLANESLARALISSSAGPALVIASSRTEGSSETISSNFWAAFFNTGDIGRSFLDALQLYVSDQSIFSVREPRFLQYNFYLTKVVYGDVSWRMEDPRKNVVVNSTSTPPSLPESGETNTLGEDGATPVDQLVALPLLAVFLCCAFGIKLMNHKPRIAHVRKRLIEDS